MNRLTIKSYSTYDKHKTFSFARRNSKELIISFENNLDLYFVIKNFEAEPTFIIGKDNYQIYELFNTLYNDIKDCRIYNSRDCSKIKVII